MVAQNTFIGLVAWLLISSMAPPPAFAAGASAKVQHPESATPSHTQGPVLTALGPRVHMFVRPTYREKFTQLFRDVLGCDTKELNFGFSYPVLLVSFPDHSAFSVEFTDLAPEDVKGETIDDAHAFRGAWIEFRARDVSAVQEKLRAAGVRSFSHPGSKHVYFSAPGGQIFRVIAIRHALVRAFVSGANAETIAQTARISQKLSDATFKTIKSDAAPKKCFVEKTFE